MTGCLLWVGDLSEKRLIHAYQNGIFPWFSDGEPIVWYCPAATNGRVYPEELKVLEIDATSSSEKTTYSITENTAFEEVIFNCKNVERKEGLRNLDHQ